MSTFLSPQLLKAFADECSKEGSSVTVEIPYGKMLKGAPLVAAGAVGALGAKRLKDDVVMGEQQRRMMRGY